MKRAFVIVLDGFGVGELPDAARFGDEGSNTLRSVCALPEFDCPTLQKLGLFHTPQGEFAPLTRPLAAYGKMAELSNAKDTTAGHWELCGLITKTPFPTYPNGFPEEIISAFEKATGRKVICNRAYSGTEVIKDYGEEHRKTGALIVYTSADSVFQIAAHESVVPLETLYEYCRIARKLLVGKHAVGRVIARPFTGEYPFTRTPNRHDFSVEPPLNTALDLLKNAGLEVVGVGKINDIFAGKGITRSLPTKSNDHGMQETLRLAKEDFHGLCFTNLVEFDSHYGHRNDAIGYAKALTRFDAQLQELIPLLKEEDMLVITADHGCDPRAPSTDHSREYVPLLVYGKNMQPVCLGTRGSFADLSATLLDYFQVAQGETYGTSFLKEIV